MVALSGVLRWKVGEHDQLPPGLQVLHAYTMLTAGSKQVLIVVKYD